MNMVRDSVILIELDALLDTRIGILSLMEDQALEKALSIDYHHRLSDQFPDVDYSIYIDKYKTRTKTTLSATTVTPMIFMLRDFVQTNLNQQTQSPFHYKPKIMINYYPYSLTDIEIQYLIGIVRQYTSHLCDIEMVSMEYASITPQYLKQHISVFILYDYTQWLEIQSELKTFEKMICPEVTLLGPAIYFKQLDKIPKDPSQDFKDWMFFTQQVINLKLLPVKYFSTVLTKQKETTV